MDLESLCLENCDTADNQEIVTNCSAADPCNLHSTCAECTQASGCNFCEGLATATATSTGQYCTKIARCGNPSGCGYSSPCIATVVTNCTLANKCNTYTSCLSCINQPDFTTICNWCENNGIRTCSLSCAPGSAAPTCAIFGPTTTGLTVVSGGQTTSQSTGSNGMTPTSGIPGGSGSPGTGNGIPSGSGSPTATSNDKSGNGAVNGLDIVLFGISIGIYMMTAAVS